MSLQQVFEQLQETAGWSMYSLKDGYIDAGDGLQITLEPEGTLSLRNEQSFGIEGERACMPGFSFYFGLDVQSVHKLVLYIISSAQARY